MHNIYCWCVFVQLQLGVQGILVLDARETGPAGAAGVHGTKRDQTGRLVLGDIITGFNSMRVRCSPFHPPLLAAVLPAVLQVLKWLSQPCESHIKGLN